MSKMFRCDNGTMFSIDEVLSIKEAATCYDKEGNKFKPCRTFSSEKELFDAMPTIARKPREKSLLRMLGEAVVFIIEAPFNFVWGLICGILYFGVTFVVWVILWLVCMPFRLLLGTTYPGSYPRFCGFLTKEERKKLKREEREKKERLKAEQPNWYKESYLQRGYFADENYNYYTVKQWDVTLRNQQKKIHIFNPDYERLRAEMGSRDG